MSQFMSGAAAIYEKEKEMTDFENSKVKVKQGWLQGYSKENVKIFKGIPFAAPPIGERRFKKPEDP